MKICIVDDTKEDADLLMGYIEQFQKEKNITVQTDVFYSSIDFLEEFRGEYDVVFLDIEMPGSNGLETAREIRAKDQTAGIVFVTNMAQYAVDGYEVNAIDFMVKPVGYFNFSQKLEKAIRFVKSRNQQDIILSNKDGIVRLSVSEIYYIEKERDNLIFHSSMEQLKKRGSIKEMKEKMESLPFAESEAGCLVNLSYVKRIGKETIMLVSGEELPLSRRMKKQFTQEYIRFVGGV